MLRIVVQKSIARNYMRKGAPCGNDNASKNHACQSDETAELERQKAVVIENLDKMAVPMLEVAYTAENYNNYFRGGYVKTPVTTVRMGTDQFAKLGRKDDGGRQSYIGAAYQTLTDPIAVIREGTDDVYIKSFINKEGVSTFMSVEKDKEDGRFVVTNYIRHKKEVEKKIKRADGIDYVKDDVGGSPASMDKGGVPHAEGSHTSIVLSKYLNKSRLFIKKGRMVWSS